MDKKGLSLFFLLLLGVTGYVQAQALSETLKITQDQVPASIKKVCEKEFGEIPEGGNWTVRINRTKEQGRVVATPVSYTYTDKSKKDKVEVRFAPDGEILNSKGLAKKDSTNPGEPGSGQHTN
jgi:hypothetical protein